MDPDDNKRLTALLEDMDSYLSSHGLGKNTYNAVVDQYMNISPDVLSKMSADQLGEASYLLSQYALYLQREINQKKAILDWSDRNIDKLVMPILSNYGDKWTKFEEKRMSAILENPHAVELAGIRGKALNQLTSLSDLPYRVEKMSDRLAALQATRRKRYE